MNSRDQFIFKPMGNFLREQREAAGLSQTEVGKLLGVTPQFISNWERGVSSVPLEFAKTVCLIYGMPKEKYVAKCVEFYGFYLKKELGMRYAKVNTKGVEHDA